jgi:hypothetical protein
MGGTPLRSFVEARAAGAHLPQDRIGPTRAKHLGRIAKGQN